MMKNKPVKPSDRENPSNEILGNKDLSDLNYPPKEDIMNPSSEMERVDINVDNLSRSVNPLNNLRDNVETPSTAGTVSEVSEEEDDLGIIHGNESDVTKEDLILLGERKTDNDMGADEEFKNTALRLDATGDDLDVPGAEADDENEKIGEEDEENNYYSLGGDRKDDLENDQA